MTQNLKISSADYDSVKADLVEFMSSLDEWKDYNFKASGLDAILSVLAYQIHYGLFYGNMISSETTLDSATLRSSIVSIAKDLSYTPRSVTSARATIKVTSRENASPLPSVMLLPKGTLFDGKSTVAGDAQEPVTFVVTETVESVQDGDDRIFNDVELIQGAYRSIEFVVDSRNEDQRFVLPSENVDVDKIEVYVQNSSDDSSMTRWTKADTPLGTTAESTVFYLTEIEDARFSIRFGDGILGRAVEHGKIVRVVYLETVGEDGNDFDSFTLVRRNDSSVTQDLIESNVEVTTVAASSGGLPAESKESIRRRAPRRNAARERAVNEEDWLDLVLRKFPDVKSVRAWGDSGRVYLSCNPVVGAALTTRRKTEIQDSLTRDARVFNVRPTIVDPEKIYVGLRIVVGVKPGVIDDQSDVATAVRDAVLEYSKTKLQEFDGDLLHSRLSNAVDESHAAIVGSQIRSTLRVDRVVEIGKKRSLSFDFKNPIAPGTFKTSSFQWENRETRLESTTDGRVVLVRESDGTSETIGVADHDAGTFSVSSIVVQRAAGSKIKALASPVDLDVMASLNAILEIDQSSVSVEVSRKK